MQRAVVFEDTEAGREFFERAWDGFRLGTVHVTRLDSLLEQQGKKPTRTRDVKRRETAVRRGLKVVSRSVKSETDPTDPDSRHLVHDRGDQIVVFEQVELKLLIDYGWLCPWSPHVSESAQDMLDYLDAAPKAEKTDPITDEGESPLRETFPARPKGGLAGIMQQNSTERV